MGEPNGGPTLLLSFDVEDWHQLLGRDSGLPDWNKPHAAFDRQAQAVFDLLDVSGSKATFFLLGLTVQNYPDLVREIVRRGDEVACHGFAHRVVYGQTREAFRRDVESSIELIEKLAGKKPIGYRAPLFSINRDAGWALELLAELGFAYDASQNDSPKIPSRIRNIPQAPYRLRLPSGRELWEFPLATLRAGRVRVPIGGGSYWRVFNEATLHWAFARSANHTPYAPLYFHSYECDPEPLSIGLPADATALHRLRARWYEFRYGIGRQQLMSRLRSALRHFRVMNYHEALQQLRGSDDAGSRSLSARGDIV